MRMVDVPLGLQFHFASVNRFGGWLIRPDLNVSTGARRNGICASGSVDSTSPVQQGTRPKVYLLQ